MVIVRFSRAGNQVLELSLAYGYPVIIEGDASWFNWNFPVQSEREGRTITFHDDAEEWARSLPAAYTYTPWQVTVIRDDQLDQISAPQPGFSGDSASLSQRYVHGELDIDELEQHLSRAVQTEEPATSLGQVTSLVAPLPTVSEHPASHQVPAWSIFIPIALIGLALVVVIYLLHF